MKLYVVQNGDSVAGIAGKHHMSVSEFRTLNDGILDEKLVQGMKVKVSAAVQPLKVQRSEKIKQQAPEAAAPVTEVKAPKVKAPEVQAPQPQMPNPQPAAAVETKQPAPQEKAGEYNTIFYPAASTVPNPPQPQPYGAQFYSPAASAPHWPAPGYTPAPAMHPSQAVNPYANYPGHPAASAKGNDPNSTGFYAPSSFTPMPPVQHYFPQTQVKVNPYPVYNPAQMAPVPPAALVNHPPAAASPAQNKVFGAAAANPVPAAPVSPVTTGKTDKKNEAAAKSVKKKAYPFLPAGSIHLNAPVGAQGNVPPEAGSPWQQPAKPPMPKAPVYPASKAAMPGIKPAANKGNAVAPEKIGGYPQPFIPAKQKPCGCGEPAPYSYPYSPFGTSPQIGYYGGNRPPEEIPYSALSPATPTVYQPARKNNQSGR